MRPVPARMVQVQADLVVDGVGHVIAVLGDNHDALDLLHAVLHHVDDLEGDEVGQQGVHGPVQAEENPGGGVDDHVAAEDDLPHGQAGLAADEQGYGLGAVQAAAAPEHQPHPAPEHAAKDHCQRGPR